MKLSEAIWSEDECTLRDPTRRTIEMEWFDRFGTVLSELEATEVEEELSLTIEAASEAAA